MKDKDENNTDKSVRKPLEDLLVLSIVHLILYYI